MVSLSELPTPLVTVDLENLTTNIEDAAETAKNHQKNLWPMIKSHKSVTIAKLQKQAGASGFVCGTLDEAEMLANTGFKTDIMLGYPITNKENIKRVSRLLEDNIRILLRVDHPTIAKRLNAQLSQKGLQVEFTVPIDVGYHRHGVRPEKVGTFVKSLEKFTHLEFTGIVTHPGHVYEATRTKEVETVAKRVAKNMRKAVNSLHSQNFDPHIVGTGSTPTFRFDVQEDVYTHVFPGNYVYYDREQALIFGSTTLERCALTVLTTVISIPSHSKGTLAILNAGSTYFDRRRKEGLTGYGHLIGYPKAVFYGLSQEVSEINIQKAPQVSVGDTIQVIPNHSCITNNSVSFLIGHRSGEVRRLIPIEGRNGTNIESTLINTLL